MYKVLFIGDNNEIKIDRLKKYIKEKKFINIECFQEKNINKSMEHFFDASNPIIFLIMEEKLDGLDEFIQSIKSDEAFSLLPILLILKNNDLKIKKKYMEMGVEEFITQGFDIEEFILVSSLSISHRIKLDKYINDLSEVTEKNITKSIQLDILKKYIPQTVWDKTVSLAQNQKFQIPEEEQDLAIIYGDIKSFTALTESHSPAEVIQHLNTVFDVAAQVIYMNGGDIDKFIGDAFLAVFTNPTMAVLSSIIIQEELKVLNEEKINNNENLLLLRLGLHYGRVIRGSVGGNMRYDNTLIGDPINTAQRLETLSTEGEVLASKEIISKVNILPINEMQFIKYELKGKNVRTEAVNLMNYYYKNKNVKDILFKYRKEIISNDVT